MVTQTVFDADTYVRREIVTDELDWLADELCRRTGRPRVAAGTKGDRFHLAGAHRSQEFLLRSPLATHRTYTVQPGLTADQQRYIAGFDFTPGDTNTMIAQSRRLMAAVKSGRLEAVREVYCNTGGDRVVDGWDNVRDRAATSDDSHLWHWHLSLDRTRLRDAALMRQILAVVLGGPVPITPAPAPPPATTDTAKKGRHNMILIKLASDPRVYLSWGDGRAHLTDQKTQLDPLRAAGMPLITVASDTELDTIGGPLRTSTPAGN